MLYRVDFKRYDRDATSYDCEHGIETEDAYQALASFLVEYADAGAVSELLSESSVSLNSRGELPADLTIEGAIKLFLDDREGKNGFSSGDLELEYDDFDGRIYQIQGVRPEDTIPCPTCQHSGEAGRMMIADALPLDGKHTRGPWRAEIDADGKTHIIGARYVATLCDWKITGAGSQYDEQNAALRVEWEANRSLIAAAPMLLATLYKIRQELAAGRVTTIDGLCRQALGLAVAEQCPNCQCDDCGAVRWCDGCSALLCVSCWAEHNKEAPDHTAAGQ